MLARKLPGVRNRRVQRDAALVAVVKVNLALLRQLFKFGQAFNFERINIGVGLAFGPFSYSLVTATMFLI